MPIPIACPHCRKEYNLPPDLAGRQVRCQACRTTFPVPTALAVSGGGAEAPAKAPPPKAAKGAAAAPVEEEILEVELAEAEEAAAPPAKGRTWLFVLLGCGLAAFLLVGVVVAGVVAAVLFLPPRSNAPVANNTTNTGSGSKPVSPPATKPAPPPDTKPAPPSDTKPAPPPATKPTRPPQTKPEPDDEPVGPRVDADPLPEPLQPPADPHGTLPLPSADETRNNPVRYPWGPGPIVAVASAKRNDDVWQVWNLQSMKQLGTVPGPSGADLKLSPDGTYAALPTHAPGSIRTSGLEIYTIADGKALRKLPVRGGNDSRIGITDFAGPGQFLSLQNAGQGGVATVWDVKTGEQICTFKTVGHISHSSDALSPGGRYLAMFDSFDFQNHTIHVHEVTTGKVVRTIKPKLPQASYYTCQGLAFSWDGKELAVLIDSDGSDYLHAWDFETGKRTAAHPFKPPLAKAANVPSPGFLGTLEWLPDRSGWFAYSQVMIDRERGNIIWNLPQKDPAKGLWVRRFLDADHYATVVDKSPRQRQLEIFELPKDEIDAARKK